MFRIDDQKLPIVFENNYSRVRKKRTRFHVFLSTVQAPHSPRKGDVVCRTWYVSKCNNISASRTFLVTNVTPLLRQLVLSRPPVGK